MTRRMLSPLLGLVLMVSASLAHGTVRGQRLTVNVSDPRKAQLAAALSSLRVAGVQAYGVLYRTRSSPQLEGAMLVASVKSSGRDLARWMRHVGSRSIGFVTDVDPGGADSGSGYVRIGEKVYDYDWVRGEGWGDGLVNLRYGSHTEATFIVSPEELAAFKAFYVARSKKLIKDSSGNPIEPTFENPGKCNLKQEACAGAASSAFHPGWVRAFKRSLPGIKAFGRDNNLPELANAPDDGPALIRAFTERHGLRQQASPKVMVRTQSIRASMLTAFQSSPPRNPEEKLAWNRTVTYYSSSWGGSGRRERDSAGWIGLGVPFTILDLPNNQTHRSFATERLALPELTRALH